MENVLNQGTWRIRSVSLILNIWNPNSELKKEDKKKVPVWVKMFNVPVVAYSKVGLSLITSKLGRLIMMDTHTSNMCLNSWGMNSYVRALVEISAENDFVESLVVAVPIDKGKGHHMGMPYKGEEGSSSYEYGRWICAWPVVKQNVTSTSKTQDNPPISKKDVNVACDKPSESSNVFIDDFPRPTNEKVKSNFIQDDIDLGQLRRNMDKLMEEDKVLDINTDIAKSVINKEKKLYDVCDTNMVSTSISKAPAEVNVSEKGSFLEQFLKSREASKNKYHSSMTDSDESKVEEVCMPGARPCGGTSDCLEDDLDGYDGYEAHFNDLNERGQAFCDQYDIRLNSRCRK
ncbi:zinc knuckle CX2CX4HX4C containing protein [Tanacetum coccineum]